VHGCFTPKNVVPNDNHSCPAHRLYRTGSDATAAGGGERELSEWQRSIKSRISVSPKILSGNATGKLVGAVTHVLVNDPTTGYGIFIENMLDAAA